MRIIIKGGVWKNTEDEILKAAVSKYGKNQWARISSLLVRKSPKQCKARWYEWLDPSIKKTEWSKEEDEKLLHLAKLMPTQWRTIAPIVGRTPAQCLERYQKLLDEAEARESSAAGDLGLTGSLGPESGPSADDVRRLRPGEIDPDPEAKPARPDPVDMDEDEKEMLSEARARLANTQGKKAKRKARERQLEEARRLASLQKRRELKAAGIELKAKKKKLGMDYNADIPFEKRPAIGFYDTTEEKNRPQEISLTNVHLSKLDKRRADQEDEKQKVKKRKAKEGKDGKDGGAAPNFIPASTMQLNKLKEAEQISKRRKLMLPAPQVGEGELEEIVKIGFAGENAKSMVDENENAATRGLLGNYSTVGAGMPIRTPRTPAAANTIMLEAQNLRALNTAQTPLLGEENTPLHTSAGTGFDGITPRHAVVQTPNLLMTPLRGAGGKVGATPRRMGPGATPMRTPFRDDLSINDQDGASVMGETPREQRMRQTQLKQQLKQGFMNLPAPRNEYDILIPDVDKEKDEAAGGVAMDEDMSDVARRSKEMREAEEKARLQRRSQAVQRDLPRPFSVNAKALVSPPTHNQTDDPLAEAERLVNAELVRLLRHDTIKYPVHGSNVAPGAAAAGLENLEDEFDDELMATARKLVTSEFALLVGVDLEEIENGSWKMSEADREKFDEAWRRENEDVVFAPSLGKFVKIEEVDVAERIKGLEKMLESNRKSMILDAARADKIEKKLNITLGGYQARSQTLQKQIVNAFEELEQSEIELESFRNLQIAEKDAIPRRIEALQREVDQLTTRERELQYRYKSIDDEKRRIMDDLIVRLEKQKGSEVDVNVGDTAEGGKMDGVE